MPSATANPIVNGADAHAVAFADAARVYRHLGDFRVEVVLEEDGWHVDYWLRDPNLCGGGPHYIIDATTGAIVYKRYDQ